MDKKKEKDSPQGSFHETEKWQLLEFARSTVDEKFDFLEMMYEAMLSAKKARK